MAVTDPEFYEARNQLENILLSEIIKENQLEYEDLARQLNMKENELSELLDSVVDEFLGEGTINEHVNYELFQLGAQYIEAVENEDHKGAASLRTKMI